MKPNKTATLYIVEKPANFEQSKNIASANSLRLLTYQEALSRSSELVNELKGKWFYLSGEGFNENGVYTFDNNGALARLSGNESIDLVRNY